jgi:cAMP-specific phosphodiesterase 4
MYRPRSLYLSVHTAPVAVPDRPEGQFSFPDTLSPAKQSSSTPDLCAKASPGDSTPPISSPSTAAKRLAAAGRRNSFLYETDGDTALPSSSLSSHMEETFVTPFAQILATMHKVRQSFIHLMNLPEDTHRHFHHKPLTPNPLSRKPPLTPFDRKLSLDTIRQHAVATLEQIDWCLQQLEGVDSAKAMGGPLAQDKFHRLLSSKLSDMSEHSKSGHQLAEWVQDITRSTDGEGTHTSPSTAAKFVFCATESP